MIVMRRTVLAASVAALALFAVPALAAIGGNQVVGKCTKSSAAPAEIILTCADAGTYLLGIRWQAFGGATARGTARFYDNPCDPSCVASKDQVTPVRFTLTAAKPCPDGVNDYRQMSITFIGKPPKHFGRHYNPKLYCPIP